MEEKMRIVYCYVCGDILHTGHLLQLENAKALGDKLIVGVLTDKAVMEKKAKPTIPFRERLRLVQAIKYVDCVVAQDEYSPLKNIMGIKPDILAESASHDTKPADNYVEGYGGLVISFPYYPDTSSTEIKKKVRNG